VQATGGSWACQRRWRRRRRRRRTMHRCGCRQAFWVDHSMLHRVLKGVDGLPGRLPWTDMSGWTPLPPAPSRERAKPAPWYDIPANSSCKGGSPVLICLGCPPGSAHRCNS
jgi:hypothetical protein